MQRKSTYVLWTCIYIHVYVHLLNLDVEMCAHMERDMWGFSVFKPNLPFCYGRHSLSLTVSNSCTV